MNVRAIQEVGEGVIGHVTLSIDLDEIPTLLSSVGGPATRVLKGVETVRPARRDEWGQLPVLGFWDLSFIKRLAERSFAG